MHGLLTFLFSSRLYVPVLSTTFEGNTPPLALFSRPLIFMAVNLFLFYFSQIFMDSITSKLKHRPRHIPICVIVLQISTH